MIDAVSNPPMQGSDIDRLNTASRIDPAQYSRKRYQKAASSMRAMAQKPTSYDGEKQQAFECVKSIMIHHAMLARGGRATEWPATSCNQLYQIECAHLILGDVSGRISAIRHNFFNSLAVHAKANVIRIASS